MPGTWWECGAPTLFLGLPNVGLTHSRDLAHDWEEPSELEVVLALRWEGLLHTSLGGMLLLPWAPTGPAWRACQLLAVRRQKNQPRLWKRMLWFSKKSSYSSKSRSANSCHGDGFPTQTAIQSFLDPGSKTHTVGVRTPETNYFKSTCRVDSFKSLLHMAAFIGHLTVKKKGYYSTQQLKEVTVFQVITNRNAKQEGRDWMSHREKLPRQKIKCHRSHCRSQLLSRRGTWSYHTHLALMNCPRRLCLDHKRNLISFAMLRKSRDY